MTDNATRTGGCLCGAVRYRIDGPVRDVVACHCGQCRKTTGHFMAAVSVPQDRFEMTEARGLKWYRSSDIARRGFCGECGSTLFWLPDTGSHVSIAAGTLDDDSGLRLQGHIFTATKGGYYDLEPDLPSWEGEDGGAFPVPE